MGIEVELDNSCIWLPQKLYAEDSLKIFKINNCNSVKALIETRLKLVIDGKGEEVHPSLFRSLISSLRYLLHIQSNITCNMSYLTRFMHKLTSEHMNAVKRVLRYIKGTSLFDLRCEKGRKYYTIQGYSDSDFGGDADDQKSTTCQIFFFGKFWYHLLYSVVAFSSCEVEYIVASAAACQGDVQQPNIILFMIVLIKDK